MPLLTTKLHIPPVRAEWVPRPRLVERLSAGLDGRRLTLISAPAGSGKTSLAAAWLAALGSGFRAAWLSLDEGDNDPARFLAYLVAALRAAGPQIGTEALRLLERAPAALEVEPVAASLINDLAGLGSPAILVLDDYHAITELAVHEAVGLLVDRQPPSLHLAIATRHDPPLPLSRLRGRGQMAELRQSDLRFTPEEAAAFLNRSMGLRLAPDEVAALEAHTEGWIAGLQMAALSMQGRDPAAVGRFIDGFSGRYHFILDYLTDEVLQRQPQAVQTFLLHTSILDRMCGPLCDAVLAGAGLAPGRRMLAELEAANLFVAPLDDEREWYRTHHLFAELLRARLNETQPDLAPELHRRAAAWHEGAGLASEAVQHALATGDDGLAAETVERAILRIATWSRADTTMIRRWLAALPGEAVRDRPWLRLFGSRLLYVSGQPEQASRDLQALEAWLREHPAAPGAERIVGLVVADWASYAAMLGNVSQAKELARQMLAGAPPDDPIARLRTPAILGMAHARAGEVAEAHRAFSQAAEIALAAGLGFAAAPLLCNLAETEITKGRLRQAARTVERAEELAVVGGTPMSLAGFARLEMGKILFEWNDLPAAERSLAEGLELLGQGGIGGSFGGGHAVLAQVRQARGDRTGALEAAHQAVDIARRENIPRLIGLAEACRARVWLAQGRIDLASRWAGEYRRAGEVEYLRELEDLTLARVLLAEGRAAGALAVLDARLGPAVGAGRLGAAIEMQVLRALALPDAGAALDALGQALALAEPEGYVRPFLDGGEPLCALLKRAAAAGIAPRYAAGLLAACEPSPRPAQPLVEPLTGRELEVLRLLAEGLSNREVGARLFISLPTVKSHTRSIYGKLGAGGRAEAVALARDLGILV